MGDGDDFERVKKVERAVETLIEEHRRMKADLDDIKARFDFLAGRVEELSASQQSDRGNRG